MRAPAGFLACLCLLPAAAAVPAVPELAAVPAVPGLPAVPEVPADVPDLPVALPVQVPADLPVDLPLVQRPEPAAAEAQPAPAGSSEGTIAGLPPAVAVPVAAGGLAALLAFAARFLGFGLVARLFSRIEGPRVLEHPARARLHALVGAQPGLTLEELRESAGLSWTTAVHHLRRLEGHGLVVSTQSGRRHRYYLANTDAARHRTSLATLAPATAQRIARLVHDTPGLGQQQICDTLGLRGPAASKHLGRFATHGLVTVKADGRRRLYEPTDALRAAFRAVPA